MPKEIQKELAEVVGEQSPKTIVNYYNMLTRLRKALMETTPIKDISADVLIKTIKDMDIPSTSKQSKCKSLSCIDSGTTWLRVLNSWRSFARSIRSCV